MPELRHLIAVEEEKELKALGKSIVLTQDPLTLPRHQFDRYLRAKASALVAELSDLGYDDEACLEGARIALYRLDAAWREEAKRIAILKRKARTP